MDFITHTYKETMEIGTKIGEKAFSSMIIALYGDVGAGKTVFTKGLTKGLDSFDPVSSPTFAIMNVYDGKIPVYHFDFYRLEHDCFEFDEYIYGKGVAVIEWPNNLDLDDDVLKITIHKIDEDKRKISIQAKTKKYQDFIKDVFS